MPSGTVHRVATTALVAASSIAVGLTGWADGAFVCAGEALGLVIHPDLDLAENRRLRALGLFGRLWAAYWWPYGKLVRHRGISHLPVLGTIGRAVYVAPLCAAGVWVAAKLGIKWEWEERAWQLGLLLLGLCISDLLHALMDG